MKEGDLSVQSTTLVLKSAEVVHPHFIWTFPAKDVATAIAMETGRGQSNIHNVEHTYKQQSIEVLILQQTPGKSEVYTL